MGSCVFCKVVSGEIPTDFVYQNDKIVVFKDIHPVKPTHLLVIPKAHVADYTEIDKEVLFVIKEVIADLVKEMGLKEKGYRVEVSGGTAMGVPHLHFHLLSPVGVAEKV